MILLQNIHLAFGGDPILDGLTWAIRPGARVGLIGPNGAGKSTLLKLIAGRLKPDEGTISMPGGTTIGYLEQDVQEGGAERTVLDAALEAFAEVQAILAEEHRLTQALDAQADHDSEAYLKLLHDFDRVQTELTARDAHLIRPKTEAVLTGLGFDPEALDRPLATFSGGWRMRAVLARLLLRQPDYLLLDEPTNHLDIESIAWFENYLKGYAGTVVLVSHDRYFLDRMVTEIAEVTHGRIADYTGNYSYYLTAREQRRTLQRAAYENQQREIAETERFIERFRYKASKARQVQSRVKHLERLERIPPPPSDETEIHIRFPEPRRSGRTVLALSRFSKTYHAPEGDIRVFEDAGPVEVERGDKIALIGKNGAGKSTLARILRGTEPFDGTRELGHHVDLTFFAQHQAEALHPAHTVIESLREQARGQSDTELRTLLGAFLFSGDDVFKTVSVLSGGEKSRLALARTLLHPANFLILDEPTNHLDIQSIGVLVEALRQYTGSFVVVSHDRHFLDQVCNHIWHVGDGRVLVFDGTYSEYEWHREYGTAARLQGQPDNSGSATPPDERTEQGSAGGGPKSKEQKRREAEERRIRHEQRVQGRRATGTLNAFQLRQAYEAAEAVILEKEERLSELEAMLADPDLYANADSARTATGEYESLQHELDRLYKDWESLASELAAAEA